eukprot:14591117-Ditylum_brightwellii.AAC.1
MDRSNIRHALPRKDGYFSKTRFLHDLVNNQHLPFTNIFNKGYRSHLAACHCRRQLMLQPDYAKSNMRFRGIQTLQSVSIATDRSGNERAVNVCKLSGPLKRGLEKAGDWQRLNE